jgi:glycosyltransferase involved in cell wall biosynthesis
MDAVVIIDNSRIRTGALRAILDACAALRDRYEFSFVLDADSTVADEVRARGYDVAGLPLVEVSRSWRSLLYLPALLVNAVRVLRILDRRRASVLHVNDVYNMLGVACKLLRPRLRLVQHVRLLRSSYLGPAYPFFAWCVRRQADEIVCVSDAALRDFGGAAPRVRRIYDAPTLAERHPPKDYARTDGCRFVYVANYIRGKGQDLALEAFALIVPQLPGAVLRFLGAGADGSLDRPFVEALRRRCAELGMLDRVRFDGHAPDVEREMKGADVVVNLPESESFSMVCLEALAYGMPLVASDCGGPREIVDHMRSGLLVPNRDVDAAARAMLRLAEDAPLAERLGREGWSSVRAKFDPARSARELACAYGAPSR